MNKAERIKRLTKGLMLLILAQAGYTLAVIVYQEQIQLLCAMLSLVGGIWGLAVLSPLAADYKRALVMCLIVQIALGLLSLPMDRFVIGYLVVRVGMYVGTYLQAWLVCGATAQEMQYLNRTDLVTQGRMIPKLYVLELAGRILNLLSILRASSEPAGDRDPGGRESDVSDLFMEVPPGGPSSGQGTAAPVRAPLCGGHRPWKSGTQNAPQALPAARLS